MGRAGLALLLLSGALPAAAQDWMPVDARSRALGGAGVAFADGRSASLYWNPAAAASGSEKVLDFTTGHSFSFSLGLDAALLGDVAEDTAGLIDQYEFYDFAGIQAQFDAAAVTPPDLEAALGIVDTITDLGAEGGVAVDVGSDASVRVGPFGFFARGFGHVGADPIADFTGVSFSSNANFFNSLPAAGALTPAAQNLSTQLQAANPGLSAAAADSLAFHSQQSLGDAGIQNQAYVAALNQLVAGTLAGAPTSLYDNPSGVFVRLMAQAEFGVSFAVPVLPTMLDVGISLKYVVTETSWTLQTAADEDSGDEDLLEDELTDFNRVRSTAFNVDLGARFSPVEWLVTGLAVRNLIPMDHDFTGPGGKIRQEAQVRFGAAARLLPILQVGFDIDLVETESPVLPGYFLRHFGLGAEFDFSAVSLRIGWADNVADSLDHGRLTAGIGLDLWGFILDIGAQVAFHETTIAPASLDGQDEAETIPTDRAGVGITIGFNVPF
jgi:hypothetical protein